MNRSSHNMILNHKGRGGIMGGSRFKYLEGQKNEKKNLPTKTRNDTKSCEIVFFVISVPI